MALAQLKIIVSKTGEATVEVEGVTGQRCIDITKPIEELLGTVRKRTMKSESYISGGNLEKVVQG